MVAKERGVARPPSQDTQSPPVHWDRMRAASFQELVSRLKERLEVLRRAQ
jgi:hypothetical protein